MYEDMYETRGQKTFKTVFGILLIIAVFGLGAMNLRSCARCYPQKGHWDPVRGELCYGEKGP